MKNKSSSILIAFVPMLALYVVPNLISIPVVQLVYAYLIFTWQGPISELTLQRRLMEVVQEPAVNLVITIVSGIICLVLFVIWYRRLKKSGVKEAVSLGSYKPLGLVLGIFIVALGFQYAGYYIVELLGKISPDWLLEYAQTLDSAGLNSGGIVTFGFLFYAVCVAPVMEELAFRGLTMTYAMRRLSGWGATILSAALFSIVHGNIIQISYTFIFALILGRIFARTGKLWITVVTHLVFNFLSVFMESITYVGDNGFIHFGVLFTSMVAVYLGTVLIIRSAPHRNV